MNQELLPCPFCGSKVEIKNLMWHSRIKCGACSLETTLPSDRSGSQTPLLNKWNARAPDVTVDAAIAAAGITEQKA